MTQFVLTVTSLGGNEPSDADIEIALENKFPPLAFSTRLIPSREQIAELMAWELEGITPERWQAVPWRNDVPADLMGGIRQAAEAVLALIQNGADR